MFGLIVIKRGNLGCVIGFHFLWNLLQEKGWLNMPDRGGEAVFMIVLLINLGLVYWFLPGRSIDAG
jgi:membrane protease YdiL (CAAX protease family)